MAAMMPNDDSEQETPYDADGNQVTDDDDTDTAPIASSDDTNNTGDMNVEEQEDGSALITLSGDKGKPISKDFYENLAEEIIPEELLIRCATDLISLVEQDKEAREERDKQYAEGIKRTGVGGEAPGGAQFTGASKVVHPVLIEGCIDFSARAMKELVPAQGPVRTKIIGKSTPAKVDKAERKRQYMNWQLTKKISEYKPETEKMLTQLPMGGSQYKKWWYDHQKKRPCMEFVPIDNIFLPFAANSFYTAERITHWQQITEGRFEELVECRFYRDVVNSSAPGVIDATRAQLATNKAEGKEDVGLNDDGLRDVYEVSCYYDFLEDSCANGKAPYIFHIDVSSSKVLAVYRNWDEDDEQQERLHWIVESVFIPWRGVYGLGLPHIIGSLSGAITGAIRSILDNALAQTVTGGVRIKGGRGAGTTVQGNPTEFVEVDSGTAGNQDDIRKQIMFRPINQMSPVLFQITDWMVQQAKGVVAVADEKIADAKSDMPVGTALALIEQGSITFSAIHMRLHDSQARELEILHRLNCWFLDDEEVVEELGDLVVSRDDFEGPMDVIPVSDPNIFSETQRYAQMQAVIGLMGNPIMVPLFKVDKVLDRALQLMNVQNREELLNIKPEAEDIDPVSENMMVALGEQPIKAFIHQDHMAHIKVHLAFMTSPVFGGNPLIGPKILPQLMDNVYQHMVMFYAQHMHAAMLTGQALNMPSNSPDDRYAVVQHFSDQLLAKEVSTIGPMLQQALQMTQQAMQQAQQPPLDPQAQVGMADVKRKEAYDQQDLKLRQTKDQADAAQQQKQLEMQTQADQAREQAKLQMEQQVQAAKDLREKIEQSQKDQREREELQSKQWEAQLKAHTDMTIAAFQAHLKEQSDKHAAALEHVHNVLNTTFEHQRETENLRQQREADEKKEREATKNMASGGSVKPAAPAAPTVVQQDPEHVKALNDLTGALKQHITKPQGGDPAMAFALTKLGQAIESMSAQQAQSNQQLAGSIVHAVTSALAQTQQELRVVAAAAGAASQGHQAVASSFDQLNQTMRAPRKRVLSKDRKGNKTVVDKIDDEGEE